MPNKYKRTNFYDDVEVDGVMEKDFLSGYFQKFELKRPTMSFTITEGFVQRPDLLALRTMGKMQYWPILGYVNDIYDWWNDISVGDVIQVPDSRDLEDWVREVKKLKRSKK